MRDNLNSPAHLCPQGQNYPSQICSVAFKSPLAKVGNRPNHNGATRGQLLLVPVNSAKTSKKTFSISNKRPSSTWTTTAQLPLLDGRIGRTEPQRRMSQLWCCLCRSVERGMPGGDSGGHVASTIGYVVILGCELSFIAGDHEAWPITWPPNTRPAEVANWQKVCAVRRSDPSHPNLFVLWGKYAARADGRGRGGGFRGAKLCYRSGRGRFFVLPMLGFSFLSLVPFPPTFLFLALPHIAFFLPLRGFCSFSMRLEINFPKS